MEAKRHAHTMRHSVHMLDSGFAEEEVKDRPGHRDRDIRSTEDGYAKISNRKRDEIGRRMDRANFIVKA